MMDHIDSTAVCVCCSKPIGNPEEDGSVHVLSSTCHHCGAKQRNEDIYVCAVCYYFLEPGTQNGETDNDLVEMGLLKPGETIKQKIRELRRKYKNTVGIDFNG